MTLGAPDISNNVKNKSCLLVGDWIGERVQMTVYVLSTGGHVHVMQHVKTCVKTSFM